MQFDALLKKSAFHLCHTWNVENISGIFSKPNMQIHCHYDASLLNILFITVKTGGGGAIFKYVEQWPPMDGHGALAWIYARPDEVFPTRRQEGPDRVCWLGNWNPCDCCFLCRWLQVR